MILNELMESDYGRIRGFLKNSTGFFLNKTDKENYKQFKNKLKSATTFQEREQIKKDNPEMNDLKYRRTSTAVNVAGVPLSAAAIGGGIYTGRKLVEPSDAEKATAFGVVGGAAGLTGYGAYVTSKNLKNKYYDSK